MSDSDSSIFRGQPRNARQILPALDRILDGGSSISFNLIAKRQEMENPEPFFLRSSLNDIVIFKYPNYGLRSAYSRGRPPWSRYYNVPSEYPIETGVFQPYSPQDPSMGGMAIYLRQNDFIELLIQHLGIDLRADDPEIRLDKARLEVMDGIPSLDPFLLKYALDEARLPCPPGYLNLSVEEESRIRAMVELQIRPIIFKAEPRMRESGAVRSDNMVNLIWDAAGSNAGIFLAAFHFTQEQVADVLSGFRGICYYRYQFNDNLKEFQEVAAWLRDAGNDLGSGAAARASNDLLKMLKESILTRMANLIRQITKVFGDYDNCVAAFVQHDDPAPLRQFLVNAKSNYWFLGKGTSSLRHVCELKKQVLDLEHNRALAFDQLSKILLYMQYSLTE
jgi:hypothetical protein